MNNDGTIWDKMTQQRFNQSYNQDWDHGYKSQVKVFSRSCMWSPAENNFDPEEWE